MRRFLSGLAVLTFTMCSFGEQVPRPAKDYPIKLTNGQTVMVSQLKGKPLVIEFLLTTCPHCQATAGTLSRLTKEFSNQVQVYGIAMNENPDIAGFIKANNVTFPVGTGPREAVYDFLDHSIMNPRLSFPQVLFIDRNGVVQSQYEGGQDFLGPDQEKNIRAELKKLTAAGPTRKPAAASSSKKAS